MELIRQNYAVWEYFLSCLFWRWRLRPTSTPQIIAAMITWMNSTTTTRSINLQARYPPIQKRRIYIAKWRQTSSVSLCVHRKLNSSHETYCKASDVQSGRCFISFDFDGIRFKRQVTKEFQYDMFKKTLSSHHTLFRSISTKLMPKTELVGISDIPLSKCRSFSISSLQTHTMCIEQFIAIELPTKSPKTSQSILDDISIEYRKILWSMAYKANKTELLRIAQNTRLFFDSLKKMWQIDFVWAWNWWPASVVTLILSFGNC